MGFDFDDVISFLPLAKDLASSKTCLTLFACAVVRPFADCDRARAAVRLGLRPEV